MNRYRMSGSIPDLASFYLGIGQYELSLGLMLLEEDRPRIRNLARSAYSIAKELHHFDYAYLAAHLLGEESLIRIVESEARSDAAKLKSKVLCPGNIDQRVRRILESMQRAGNGHADISEVRTQAELTLLTECERQLERIKELKHALSQPNGAIYSHYLKMMAAGHE